MVLQWKNNDLQKKSDDFHWKNNVSLRKSKDSGVFGGDAQREFAELDLKLSLSMER